MWITCINKDEQKFSVNTDKISAFYIQYITFKNEFGKNMNAYAVCVVIPHLNEKGKIIAERMEIADDKNFFETEEEATKYLDEFTKKLNAEKI